MQATGFVLTVLGGLLCLGGLNMAFTQYEVNTIYDLSNLSFGFSVSALMFLSGLALVKKSQTKP